MSYKKRQIELLLDGETFIAPSKQGDRQFRITFEVLLDFGDGNSYCDCRIYNLSQETSAKAIKKGVEFSLRAGYDGTIDYLFKGVTRNVFKEREGPNTITRIIARGGVQPKTTITQTLGKNARVVELIKACADSMGYPLVIQNTDFSDVNPYARGYVLNGDPRVYLDSLASAHGFSYIIENEKIVVVRNTSFRTGDAYLVSESTGMEGIPEITEVGVDVSVRLQPKIRIGGRVDIQSKLRTFNFSNVYFNDVPANAGSGIYRVFKLEHSGDTWGDQWSTRITGFR